MLRTDIAHPLGPDTVGQVENGTGQLTADERKMVEANIALVHHIVGRMTESFPAAENRDDLTQAGFLGLIEATQKFDPARGVRFSTYAGRRIEGALLDYMRRSDWAPRSVRRKERKMRDVDAYLTAALHRKPTVSELSEAMGDSAESVRRLQIDLQQTRVDSLFTPSRAGEDDETIADELMAVGDGPSTEHLEHKELMGYLRDGIRLLPERHRLVIVGHFLDGKNMTELGELLGVTQSRASQLKTDALTMLKRGLGPHMEAEESTPETDELPTRRQATYNEALATASSWRERVGSGSSVAVL